MSVAKILVVGSFNYDMTFISEEFPHPGETVLGSFRGGPGGKGSNQAVASARAGASTAFIGAIGADQFGEFAREMMRREGIHAHLHTIEDIPTGTAAVLLNHASENEIVVAPGANGHLPLDPIPDSLWENAECLVCQLETNLDAVKAVLQQAKERGVRTILNPAPLPRDFDIGILEFCDILVPNETEFAGLVRMQKNRPFTEEQISTLSAAELHTHCREVGPETIILTLGSRGAVLSTPDSFRHIPARLGMKVVDTVGAGDAFIGGLGAGLVRFGGDLLQTVSFANTVAALSVSRPGAAEAMPQREEIEQLWNRR